MINLCSDTQKIIAFAVKYCDLVDIDSLLIDKNGIRAKQDEKAVYLIEPGDYDFLEFDTLYINRVKALSPRIKMFETSKMDYDINAELKELKDGSSVVKKLIISGGKTTVNFNTSIITKGLNLPKQMKDLEYYKVNMDSKDLTILKKGISAMGAENFKIFSEDGEVKCEIVDIERDLLSQNVASKFKTLNNDAPDDFEFHYNFKIIFPLLQEAGRDSETFNIVITRKGVMCLTINGLSMYIFPEIE
jgi:hypothetical protein